MEPTNQPIQTTPSNPVAEIPLQAAVSFKLGRTVFSDRIVLISLDKDMHLRVLKQPDGSSDQAAFSEIILDIEPTTATRVYASQTVLVVKIPGRTCRFDLSRGASVGASLAGIGGNLATPGGGMAGIVQMESLIKGLPLDLWLEAMQAAGFPVRRSKYNDFQNKWILVFTKGIGVALVIIIVAIIIMLVSGQYKK